MDPTCYNPDLQARHACVCSSGQNVVGLPSSFLIRFENCSMIDPTNLAINLWLETSQALAQNIILMFYEVDTQPNCLLNMCIAPGLVLLPVWVRK